MPYFQILTCNAALGTCCSDSGVVKLIDIFRKTFDTIQIIVPILLLIMATVQLIRLMANPDEKNGTKQISNKLIAAVMVFFIPMIIDVVIGMMPVNDTFKVSACWQDAQHVNEMLNIQKSVYIRKNSSKKQNFLFTDNPNTFENGDKPATGGTTTSGGTSGQGSAKGKAIVDYALQFVGQRYVYGGSWNGELPYTPTDCSGFVKGVFHHFGIELERSSSAQRAATNTYTEISANNIQAGDLVMYNGHVAMFTGNGPEVVHAMGSQYGVRKSPDYRKCSSHAIMKLVRIKGVE